MLVPTILFDKALSFLGKIIEVVHLTYQNAVKHAEGCSPERIWPHVIVDDNAIRRDGYNVFRGPESFKYGK